MRNHNLLLVTCGLAALLLLTVSVSGCGPGQVAWSRVIDLGGDDVAAGLAGNGTHLAALATVGTDSGPAWLVLKFEPDGRELWRRQYRQGEASIAGDVAIDARGIIYATGSGRVEGREMCLAVCYRPDGAILWQRALAVGDACWGRGIALGADRVYVCGRVRDGERDEVFVAALTLDGRTEFTRNWRPGRDAGGERLALAPDSGLVLVGTVGGAENPDILVAKLTPQGDTVWTRTYDGGGEDVPGGVAADQYGHVLATGTALTPEGPRCVIIEHQPDGELIRRTAYGGRVTAEGRAIAVTEQGDVFVAGTLTGAGRSMLSFQYRPGATSTWERNWRPGSDADAAALVVDGDVYALGTVEQGRGGRDVALVRFVRPDAE
ncbi:MAG: hypothetical protein R6X12_09575 [bacterium]